MGIPAHLPLPRAGADADVVAARQQSLLPATLAHRRGEFPSPCLVNTTTTHSPAFSLRPTHRLDTVIGADATSVTIALLDPATPGLCERGCRSAEEEGEDDGADVNVAGADVDVAEAARTLVAFQAAPAPKREYSAFNFLATCVGRC